LKIKYNNLSKPISVYCFHGWPSIDSFAFVIVLKESSLWRFHCIRILPNSKYSGKDRLTKWASKRQSIEQILMGRELTNNEANFMGLMGCCYSNGTLWFARLMWFTLWESRTYENNYVRYSAVFSYSSLIRINHYQNFIVIFLRYNSCAKLQYQFVQLQT
jgi:hypothetical protein